MKTLFVIAAGAALASLAPAAAFAVVGGAIVLELAYVRHSLRRRVGVAR